MVFTNCFTFNLTRVVWGGIKGKLFVANIIVPLLLALGLGFVCSAFVGPLLTSVGVESGLANMLPVMVMLGVLQIAQLWLLVWAPLEKRIIIKRLEAQGITPAQIATGVLVGISNPASGLAKRFATIEEDMGVLWVSQDQLVYWGDGEQFGLTRDQVLRVERRADKRSTTMLCGLEHVILHVKLPDGNERQIRLHVEGLWTMGQKRRVMEYLAGLITQWHSGVELVPVAG